MYDPASNLREKGHHKEMHATRRLTVNEDPANHLKVQIIVCHTLEGILHVLRECSLHKLLPIPRIEEDKVMVLANALQSNGPIHFNPLMQ